MQISINVQINSAWKPYVLLRNNNSFNVLFLLKNISEWFYCERDPYQKRLYPKSKSTSFVTFLKLFCNSISMR